ncbi:hypothetical protein [Streptococcus ruminantium]|uniref:hypothetical protein n=1 Tax=Streptococcus ruminantium TaxID=1917441 RepID=UPI0012DCBC84|nr:hypothetical protein [Streptococcus ruminantium]
MANSSYYRLKKFRLYSSQYSRQSWNDPLVVEISNIARSDYGCFRIINRFFTDHRQNNEDRLTIARRLESLRNEQTDIDEVNVNRYQFKLLKDMIVSLFENNSVNENKYLSIYCSYLEYITMLWKKIPGIDGNVYFEPTIKYDGRIMFYNQSYSNSKCDVVFRNSRNKEFSFYECKFGLPTFLNHLAKNEATVNNNKLRRQIRGAKNKLNYLKEFKNIISTPMQSNINSQISQVAIVTFTSRSSISSQLHLLNGIELITRDKLEELEVYSEICS